MNLASIGYLYAMQAVKLREKCIWVFLNVVVVIFQYFAKKFMFGVMDSLDDVLVVSREIEEATAFAG